MRPLAELLVLVFVLVLFVFCSYLGVPETDLMKQAFAAIVGFVTGGIAVSRYQAPKQPDKADDPTVK